MLISVEDLVMKETKVLIVEDSLVTAKTIKKSLKNLKYEVAGIATSGEDAIRQSLLHKPNIILMDILLDGDMNGIEAATKITNILDIPIIYLTAVSDKKMLKDTKISEGYSFLVKPFQENELYFNIEMALYKHKMKNKLKEEKKWLNTILQNIDDGVIAVDNLGYIKFINERALKLIGCPENIIGNQIFDTVKLLDINTREKVNVMELNNKERIEKILLDSNNKEHIVICQITAIPKKNKEKIGHVVTLRDITKEKNLKKDINYLTFHDQLTGVYNRTYYEKEFYKFNHPDFLPVSVIMADLNGLKLTNNVFGHAAGDNLLKKAATALSENCRSSDLIARIGGDEFIIVLPNTPKEIGEKVVKRISKFCDDEKALIGKVSIALGIATKESDKVDISQTSSEADHKMYSNKFLQSNKVCEDILNHLRKEFRQVSYYRKKDFIEIKRILFDMGKKLNFSQKQLFELSSYMEIWDIGMIIIPPEILNKNSKLDKKEWDIIKKHPEVGYKIAQATKKFSSVAEFILCHHERWDGKGYPHNLKGEDIPLISRMISIVDAYHSMVNERPYRKKFSKEEAISEISRCANTQFDPNLVDIFKSIV
jgi:diguanylate cyclase (GGDEF)-like protein/PAS domain S-box-containing protein